MTNFEKLRGLLAELFQFDQADLDFGIYRIMNQKRDEISRFLDRDMLPQVKATLEEYQATVSDAGRSELDEAVKQAQALGVDPDSSPKVQALKAKLGPVQDTAALEEEVFSDLYDFFRRYYSEGDFISLRRYREGVYAIPYEGEEVKLYWANHDQYYIKSSENFRNYTFRLPDGRTVRFRIVEAATGRDNNRAQDDKNRRFMLWEDGQWGRDGSGETDQPGSLPQTTLALEDDEGAAEVVEQDAGYRGAAITEEDGALVIRFVYLPDPQKRRQDAINSETAAAVLAMAGIGDWLPGLKTLQPTDRNPARTLLDKHLDRHTKRNTFDYFIHKDLGGFLRRELDFYIKNEVMHLDDIEHESAPRVEQYLGKVRALRKVAGKLITFLAQLEDFQKRLWLKKKFVVETNYCVTLDRVPEELWPEVFANQPQREEWAKLFDVSADGERPEPFTPFLVLDTAHFPQEFRDRLLQALDDLDELTTGLAVRSDNFQAVGLLRDRYRGSVTALYLDPPYNTDAGPISYKNGFRHSSWLSLFGEPFAAAKPMLSDEAISCITIDDFEGHHLRCLLDAVLSRDNLLGVAPIKNNPAGRTGTVGFSICHEYAYFYGASEGSKVNRLEHTQAQKDRYKEQDDEGRFEWTNFRKHGGLNTYRSTRPRQFYPIYVAGDQIRIPELAWDNAERKYIVLEEPVDGEEVLWPIDSQGRERIWDFVVDTARSSIPHFMVRKDSQGQTAIYRKWRLHSEGLLPQTWWDKSEYSAAEHGTNLLSRMFGETHAFVFPKSLHAVKDCLRVSGLRNNMDGVALDFYAGSGTTGHAVIELNREDSGSRRFVLVEMGEYFDTMLLGRLKKAAYATEWRSGKPASRESGVPLCLKYIRLESYEDALENLQLTRTLEQQLALDAAEPEAREEYLLSYMLNLEATGSQSLLNLAAFTHPFEYKLKVATGIAGETKTVNVDLVETFNYLIGLRVKHIDMIRGVRVVEGTSPAGERTLILWRDTEAVDNDALDEWFRRQGYNTRDLEYDVIYVNGDNNLENLRRADQTWKVRLIEADFHRLMFDVEDV